MQCRQPYSKLTHTHTERRTRMDRPISSAVGPVVSNLSYDRDIKLISWRRYDLNFITNCWCNGPVYYIMKTRLQEQPTGTDSISTEYTHPLFVLQLRLITGRNDSTVSHCPERFHYTNTVCTRAPCFCNYLR